MIRPIALACLVTAGAAFSQNRPLAGPMSDAGVANLPSQIIGPNDLLAVSVYDSPELTRTVRVSAEGNIILPLIADPVPVEGLYAPAVEKLIARTLVAEGIIVKPVVIVTVVEYCSRPVAVVGSVKNPLTFQAVGRVTVLDALARAEGLVPESGPEILVSRAGETSVVRISIADLMNGSKPGLNLMLHGGEVLSVPEARKIYVAGNVKKPGAFYVGAGEQMTVIRAVALAEGVDPYSEKYAYVYRPDASGTRREIRIEFARILRRQSPDLALKPDDTLYIPEDRMKKLTATATEKLLGFGTATGSGILIWQH